MLLDSKDALRLFYDLQRPVAAPFVGAANAMPTDCPSCCSLADVCNASIVTLREVWDMGESRTVGALCEGNELH